MKQKVFVFENEGLTLRVTGNNYGRLGRYCQRLGCDVSDEKAKAEFTASQQGKWTFFDEQGKAVESSIASADSLTALPAFYETTYQVKCTFKANRVTSAHVVHAAASVADEFYFDEEKQELEGPLNFINTPGRFTLEIGYTVGGRSETLKLTWWVVSEKLDVVKDYREIVGRVSQVSNDLVYAFLANTQHEGGLSSEEGKSEAVWYDIFRNFVTTYRAACEHVIHNPHLKYVEQTNYQRAERIKRWTPQLTKAYHQTPKDLRGVRYYRASIITPEVDTVENRFVLFTLTKIQERLRAFAKQCRKDGAGKVAETFIEQIEAEAESLEKLSRASFFRKVGRYTGMTQESIALQRKRGYAEIYNTWLSLQYSLDLTKDGLEFGNKPVWKLYEFWCFLVIRDWLMERYPNPEGSLGKVGVLSDIFEDPYDETTGKSKMASGENKCRYVFKDAERHREIELTYQLSYGNGEEGKEEALGAHSYVVEQIPDIVMTIRDLENAQNEHTYLFDAKYRVMPYPSEKRHEKDASPHAAINDMHRYRDAILYRSQKGGKLSREVIGAYVLYPGRAGKSYNYAEIIQNENIGAIPLLPGEDGKKELENFLLEIITRGTAKDHLEKVISTRGTSAVLGNDMPFEGLMSERLICYGTCHGEKQLLWIENKHLYNVPVDKANECNILDENDAKNKKKLFVLPSKFGKHAIKQYDIESYLGIVTKEHLKNEYDYESSSSDLDKKYYLFELKPLQ